MGTCFWSCNVCCEHRHDVKDGTSSKTVCHHRSSSQEWTRQAFRNDCLRETLCNNSYIVSMTRNFKSNGCWHTRFFDDIFGDETLARFTTTNFWKRRCDFFFRLVLLTDFCVGCFFFGVGSFGIFSRSFLNGSLTEAYVWRCICCVSHVEWHEYEDVVTSDLWSCGCYSTNRWTTFFFTFGNYSITCCSSQANDGSTHLVFIEDSSFSSFWTTCSICWTSSVRHTECESGFVTHLSSQTDRRFYCLT